jgi:Fe-S cluster assembly iron-binding protein IscA
MIEITDATKVQILKMLEKNPGKYVRISIEGDGCAGPYYGVTLDEPGPVDNIVKVNGIDLLISELVKRYAEVSNIRVFINPDQRPGE